MPRKRSEECRRKQSEAAKRRWASKEEREAQSARLKEAAPWKGKALSEEHRQAIGDGGRGVKHALTEERKKELGEQGRKVLAEVRQRPGYHDRQSEAIKDRVAKEGPLFGLRRPEARQKSLSSRIRNGTLVPPNSGRGITGFRKGIPHYCRSTLEANFARILIREGIPYEYEPQVFVLSSGSRWTPDFRLLQPLKDLVPEGWVELKGWRGALAKGAADKIKAFEELTSQSVSVVVQSEALWEGLEKAYSEIIPWERPGYNLKTHPKVFGRQRGS